jgi:hypothetical protein
MQRRCLALLLAATALISNLPQLQAQNSDTEACLAREGRTSIVGVEPTALYERKLFVTKDDVARYVFLTNANYDGDRSVAVYRARRKEGSFPGDYWVTSTEVSTSLLDCIPTTAEKSPPVDPRSLVVRRADAPLPKSTAQAVHKLWLAMLKGSPVDEKAIPLAPTAVISATTAGGVRLKAVTVSVGDNPRFCVALMRFGQSLINYPQLPESKRLEAAREIEKESYRLLKGITKTR